jgi:hypothetical protein
MWYEYGMNDFGACSRCRYRIYYFQLAFDLGRQSVVYDKTVFLICQTKELLNEIEK